MEVITAILQVEKKKQLRVRMIKWLLKNHKLVSGRIGIQTEIWKTLLISFHQTVPFLNISNLFPLNPTSALNTSAIRRQT